MAVHSVELSGRCQGECSCDLPGSGQLGAVAVNMFENQNELPDSSPLKEVDVKKLNEELDLLNIEKNSLLDDITKLLGK